MPHRYFTTDIGGGRAALTGPDAHHLADVMRGRVGDTVVLCDANAVEYTGTITAIAPGRVEFSVSEGYPSAAEPSVEVTLYAGYPKQGKLEDIIRHSVELGVRRVTPFFSRYCVAAPKKEDAKRERYSRIAAEAAKQCGRGILPEVSMPVTVPELCRLVPQFDRVLFFYEKGGQPLRQAALPAPSAGGRAALITGAEGGFSPEEADALIAAGAVPVGLGPRILRCETAPLAGLAACMCLWGQLE